jgi:PAS domain S-box-containing protein
MGSQPGRPPLAATRLPVAGARSLATAPVNILLVDDEPKNLTALASVLEGADRRLVCARSGPEALRYLLRDVFAAILLDVHMPGMDGFEAAKLIRGRQRSGDTPIIFLTAAIRGEIFIAKGYSLGAVDYLLKPVDPEILRSKVAVFVELFRKNQQVRDQAALLAETTALLESVLNSTTGYAILALDQSGQVLTWNEGARRLFGYEAEEVVGRQSAGRVLNGDPSSPGVDHLMELAGRCGRASAELHCLTRSGRRFIAAVSFDRRLDGQGAPIGFVATVEDLTPVKQAEEQRERLLQEQVARAEAEVTRDHLQQVIDVLPEGILIADATGRIVLSNAAAREIIGQAVAADHLTATASPAAFRSDGQPLQATELPLARAVHHGEVVRGEQLMIRNSTTEALAPVLISSAPLRDARGALLGGVAAFQDISPIKELERQKDGFLAAASHDLKNPLTIIKVRAQVLARRASRLGGPEGAALAEGLQAIDQTTRRLAGMVNELLDIARLQMGRPLELEPRRMGLVELVRNVVTELQPTTDRHEIVVTSSSEELFGTWDPGRLERVMVNLATNAVKYSPAGGRVEFMLHRVVTNAGEYAELSVQDQGIGIPCEDLPRVFERFYRARNVGAIEGTGLGLAGVRQIVEQLGGSISVASEEYRGTKFTIRLPLDAAPT